MVRMAEATIANNKISWKCIPPRAEKARYKCTRPPSRHAIYPPASKRALPALNWIAHLPKRPSNEIKKSLDSSRASTVHPFSRPIRPSGKFANGRIVAHPPSSFPSPEFEWHRAWRWSATHPQERLFIREFSPDQLYNKSELQGGSTCSLSPASVSCTAGHTAASLLRSIISRQYPKVIMRKNFRASASLRSVDR